MVAPGTLLAFLFSTLALSTIYRFSDSSREAQADKPAEIDGEQVRPQVVDSAKGERFFSLVKPCGSEHTSWQLDFSQKDLRALGSSPGAVGARSHS